MLALAAVDLGAQSGRVALGRFDGERLQLEVVHRFPNVPVAVRGRLYWDVLRLYAETLDGLRATADAARVAAVGVDAWAVDFGLLDRGGRLLGNPVHYRDARRAAGLEKVLRRVPARELYERTGIQVFAINTLNELAAMAAEPDPALAAAERLLLVPDLVHNWLCGSEATERTNATTTQCLDAASGAWAVDLLERLGAPATLLPEIVPPATPLGPVLDDVADDTGLRGATVVAAATHDTAAAVAAVPLAGERAAYLSVGTWSLVGVEAPEPVIGEAAFRANLTNEGGVAGTVRVLRNVTGLWLLHECRRAWARAGREYGYDELLALAGSAPPLRRVMDPDDPLFAAPGDMPARIADYCVRTGQEPPSDVGEVVRCVLESLALKHAWAVDLVAAVTGREIDDLHLVGGGAGNELLCAWTAEAAGRRVLAGPMEATLAGNLLVQAMALGELGSLEEVRAVVRRSFSPRIHEPSGEAGWQEARERFALLVEEGAPAGVGA